MNQCPDEEILERLLAEDDASSAEWSTHVVSCDRCRTWLSDARADDAMLATVREAWSRERNSLPVSDRLLTPAPRRQIEADAADDPVIPGYELLRRIGEGGMGVVYEARQIQPSRIVAIKVVRGGISASQVRNHLIEHEAAALARLRHPNIAAIYSAGRTDSGLFYVVMERIEGPRITQFADDARLTLRQRLVLLERVCRAIQHAHQQGVVHGDIKPGNILVDVGGTQISAELRNNLDSVTLKVLDFGLSRLVGSARDARTGNGSAHVRGTPAYMSPEQAAGQADEIDHLSDVYALGALAYELLTGRPPHDLRGLSIDAALMRVRDGVIDLPTCDHARLPGDLEAIVMKALARERDARYGGAAELADDVRRYLAHEPVRAKPESRLYAARCFLRRHAVGSAFAACAFVGLVAFAAAELVHARRLAHERDIAQHERDRAVRVNKFMQNMIADLDPAHTGGPETSLRSVLDDAAARVESELADDPETAATTQLNIGQSYVALGLFDKAEAQFRSALARRQALHGNEHGDVAEALHELGLALKLAGRPNDAEPYYLAALDMRRRLLPPDDDGIPESLNDLGGLRVDQGRFADAAAYFKEALALRKAKHGENDKEYAIGLGNIAVLEFFQGNTVEADQLLQRAVETSRKTLGADSPILIKRLIQAVYMSMHRGADPVAAEKNLRELLERQRKLLGSDHPEVVNSVQNLAVMLRMRGDSSAAAELERDWGVSRAVRTKPD